jgi:hypothetical protein
MLGANAEDVHERWLDLLSNLTLTGYNSELSNSPFKAKRELLAKSNFEMNKWIATRNQWTEAELRERTNLIFEKSRVIWARSAE